MTHVELLLFSDRLGFFEKFWNQGFERFEAYFAKIAHRTQKE